MIRSSEELKTFFETGDMPTEGNFSDLIDSLYNKIDGLEFVDVVEEPLNPTYSHESKNVLASSSTFSGWRGEIGDHFTGFRFLEIGFYPFDGTLLPNNLLVRVTNGVGGALLAEKSISLTDVVEDVTKYEVIDFGEIITANVSGNMLWVEVITDGRIGVIGGFNPPTLNYTPLVNSQYTTNANINSPSWTNVSGAVTGYRIYAKMWETSEISQVNFIQKALDSIFSNASPENKAAILSNMSEAQIAELFNALIEKNQLLEFSLGETLGNTAGVGAYWQNENSTFSGWGSGVGVLPPFQTIKFKVRTWDVAEPITQVRVRVRDTNYNGTILANVLLNLDTDVNDYLVVDFGALIDNGSNPIWFEFLTDGRAGMYGNASDIHVATQGAARYITNKDINATLITAVVTSSRGRIIEFEYFGASEPENLNFTELAINKLKEELDIQTDAPYINLPSKLYAVVGYVTQMFFRGIICDIDINKYNIKVLGNVGGKQYPRYYEFNPTAAGLKTFTIELLDKDNNLVTSKTCSVEVVEAANAPSYNTKILCLGDSLTAGGVWSGELLRLLTGSGGSPSGLNFGNVEFIGTVGSGNNLYEAYGGKTWSWFANPTTQPDVDFTVATHDKDNSDLVSFWQDGSGNSWRLETVSSSTILIFSRDGHSNNAPSSGVLTHVSGANNTSDINYTSVENNSGTAINKFWNYTTNQLDIANYVNSNGFGTIDVVYALLSWNGAVPFTLEASDHTNAINACKLWLDALHTDFPNCKVKLMGVQLPSLDGGLAQNYGDGNSNYGNVYGLIQYVFGLNKAYSELSDDPNYSSFVEFIDVATQFDSEYNMPHGQRAVNSRSAITEKAGTNGVHPNADGYYQIADVAFRNFAAKYL